MKKIRSILIFLVTFAIFTISAESFAKNRTVFSSQANPPIPPLHIIGLIKEYQDVYAALGGSPDQWRGHSLEDAQDSVENLRTQIANYRKIFGTGDQTWTGFPWTGTYDDPDTQDFEGTPTFSEARKLHNELIAEIQRLKTDYLARGGSANDWKGSYQSAPTLSEAQVLAQLLKQSKSSRSPSSNNHTLIIGVSAGVGGALLLFGGLGYWFYWRGKKS